jgi:hypothetical protein
MIEIIERGNIISTQGKYAKVKLKDSSIHYLLLFMPYGDCSNPPDNCPCLIIGESLNNAFVLPYLPSSQPTLATNEKAIGNFKSTNSITFKANGDIIISGNNLDATAFAGLINLGTGTSFVLNQNANMRVVITQGNSAGTYPVEIVTAGQSKVKA